MQKGRTFRTIFARLMTMCLALLLALAIGMPTVKAAGGDRTLYLYFTHTKETGKFTFRKNGKYDSQVLAELNHFLRDWRQDKQTKMDPGLFDLVWEVYQDVHATGPIYVVSAYRAPETNAMLRSKSGAVAKNSRHIQGMAMDFYIPSVSLAKLREAAMKKQVGGVGYYPASGSPFVHLDTGSVRAWPRMTAAQLKKLFPNGETLHLPSGSNTPISSSGYQLAQAEWSKCHTIPCSATPTPAPATTTFAVAQNDDGPTAGNGKTLMDWLFGNGEADEAAADGQSSPAPIAVASAPPPVPASPPASLYLGQNELPFGIGSDPLVVAEAAPVPEARPAWIENSEVAGNAVFTVASINPNVVVAPPSEPQPMPQISTTLPAPFVAAYAPAVAPEPDAQRALQMILERRAAEKATPPADLNTTGSSSGLAATGLDATALSALITGTMQAVIPQARPLAPMPPVLVFEQRSPDFIAPDLDHVAQLLVDPAFLSSSRFAIIFNHEKADLSPATELGALAPRLTIDGDPAFGLGRSYFAHGASLLVAAR